MLNPESIVADAEKRLRVASQKNALSPQAVSVIEAICKAVNDHIAAKKKPVAEAKPIPSKPAAPIRVLTDLFSKEWQQRFGGPYKFNGAADGKAAADLLKLGLTPEQVMAVARRAWEQPEEFNCKHAMTLRGLASRFNEIRAAVRQVNGHTTYAGKGDKY